MTVPSSGGASAAPGSQRAAAARAVLLVVVLTLSLQVGSSLAVKLIGAVGVLEAVWLRVAIAAAILVALRPRSLRLPGRGDRLFIAALVGSVLLMNLSFYAAISRAPLGIVVAVEFLGPMAVAVLGTRRPLDLLWVVLAAGGVLFLAGPGGSVSALGLVFSLISAVFWAAYLLLAKRALGVAGPLTLTVWMLGGSAVVLTPVALIGGVEVAGQPSSLYLAVGVAVLSSAIPYFLELVALRLVRAATYGVLLSVEPAVAALAAWVVLGQRLTPPEMVAMAAVMVAAAGASWTAGGAGRLDAPAV